MFQILKIISFTLISTLTYSNTNEFFFSKNKTLDLPTILSKEDIEIYKNIFIMQNYGKWEETKVLKKKLTNNILLGYLEYDKLMHPNKYKASYQELSHWFETYKDYPPVLRRRVYSLLLKRLPNHINKDKYQRPKFGKYLRGYGEDRRKELKYNLEKPIKTKLKKKINYYMAKAKHENLTEYLKDKYPREEYAYQIIGNNIDKIFYSGKLQSSLKLYDFYIKTLKINNPGIIFRAGVNSYKVKDYEKSKNYFNKCIEYSENSGAWTKSACLYWYSMAENSFTEKKYILKKAANYPRTIYGQLAIEKLNLPDPFIWVNKKKYVPYKAVANFTDNKILKRVLALSEIQLYNKADLEIRNLYSVTSDTDLEDLFLLSEKLNLAAALMRLGPKFFKSDSSLYIRGLYPTPEWDLKKDLVLDKALLFALIRRESAFNFRAKSSKGARGLMQLMPRTASKLEKDYKLRYSNKDHLYFMDLNLKIGQNFLKDLISNVNTKNSIVNTLIAYNAGMSRLKDWKKNISENDPIVFIESIPLKETRWFVKYILTDLWIYRDKLGQNKPSRSLLANKKSPLYKSLDYNYIQDAKAR